MGCKGLGSATCVLHLPPHEASACLAQYDVLNCRKLGYLGSFSAQYTTACGFSGQVCDQLCDQLCGRVCTGKNAQIQSSRGNSEQLSHGYIDYCNGTELSLPSIARPRPVIGCQVWHVHLS